MADNEEWQGSNTPPAPARSYSTLPILVAFLLGAVTVMAAAAIGRPTLCTGRLLSAPTERAHHFNSSKLHAGSALAPQQQGALPLLDESAKYPFMARYNSSQFALPATNRQRGIWYRGSGSRLRRFAAKLVAGQPVRVVTLGTSVTAGHGASSLERAYPARFEQWLNATFPHPRTQVLNRGLPASSSGVFALCLEKFMPQDSVDLVVLEFATNEPQHTDYSSNYRRGYEKLVRKLLRLPSHPAIVSLYFYAWWRTNRSHPFSTAGDFWGNAEAELGAFDQYYDIPSLSLRSAAHRLMQRGVGQFKELAPPGQVFYFDSAHPSDFGHGVLAELLIELTWQAAMEVVWEAEGRGGGAVAAADTVSDGSKGELQGGGAEGPGGLARPRVSPQCGSGGRCGAKAAQQEAGQQRQQQEASQQRQQQEKGGQQEQQQPDTEEEEEEELQGDEVAAAEEEEEELPPHMIAGNSDAGPSTCFIQESFVRAVAAASGFEFAPARPDAPTFTSQKWAWTGLAPGDWAEFVVDTREASSTPGSPPSGSNSSIVAIGYLRSYESMGAGRAECVEGCTCEGALLEGTWDIRATLMSVASLEPSQHARCRIRVTILPETQSGQHKLSLTFLLVSPYGNTQWVDHARAAPGVLEHFTSQGAD